MATAGFVYTFPFSIPLSLYPSILLQLPEGYEGKITQRGHNMPFRQYDNVVFPPPGKAGDVARALSVVVSEADQLAAEAVGSSDDTAGQEGAAAAAGEQEGDTATADVEQRGDDAAAAADTE